MIDISNRILLGLLCLLTFPSGCGRDKDRVKNYMEEMKSTPISLCLDKMFCGRNPLKDSKNKAYRMVVYVDSSECTPCALGKLRFWNPLIKEAQDKKIDIDYIFIIAPKLEDKDDVNMEMEITDLRSSIYLDTAYVFRKTNPAIPMDNRFHSFLLNKENNVIMVGSPIASEKIKDIYIRTIDIN